MIFSKTLNKSFSDKKSLFKALKSDKSRLIESKKSTIKNSDGIRFLIKNDKANKAEESTSDLKIGDTIYPIINTTNYLDSHDDVHLKGIWDESIEEANGSTKLVIDHCLSIDKIIAWEENVKVITKDIEWSKLGQSYEGSTQALIFETVLTDEADQKAFLAYKNKRKVQHSIRMRYKDIELAINEPYDDYFEEENENWNRYIGEVSNKAKAIEQGYFWVVKSADIVDEGSLVLRGSNNQTPTLYSLDETIDSNSNESEEPENNEDDDDMKNLINQFRSIINK